jgi:hypothetical protein
MKTTWIKLVVALALVLLVVGGIIFWPTETKPTDAPRDLKTPPQVQQTRVESLYQTAVFHKERDNPSDMDFRITADCCQKILTDYPDRPQAKALFYRFSFTYLTALLKIVIPSPSALPFKRVQCGCCVGRTCLSG